MSNKGAIGVKFTLHERTYLIIGAHLACRMIPNLAGKTKISKRNIDVEKIRREVQKNFAPPSERDLYSIEETIDYVIWAGDLNYRVEMTKSDAINAIYNKKYQVRYNIIPN